MNWVLDPGRSARGEVRRACQKQFARALAAIADGNGPQAHEPRKSIKRVRALVRLCRYAVPDAERRALNDRCRAIGRILGPLRDAEAMPEIVAGLARPVRPLAALRTRARSELVQKRVEARPQMVAAVAGLRALFEQDRPLAQAGGWSPLRRGLAKTYARGQSTFRGLDIAADSEAFHALRKRVKDLHYQARLFAPADAGIAAVTDVTSQLGERLGDEHDLAVLVQRLNAGWGGLPADDRRAVLSAVAERRALLRRQAMIIADHLFSERPAAFARRVFAHWRAAGSRA